MKIIMKITTLYPVTKRRCLNNKVGTAYLFVVEIVNLCCKFLFLHVVSG